MKCPPSLNPVDVVVFEFQGQEGVQTAGQKDRQMEIDCNNFILSWSVNNFHFYLFGVLCRFQHCTGHITTGSWKGRGNQYIQLVKVLYRKLPTNGKQLPAFFPT